jgi:VWFA-related protein
MKLARLWLVLCLLPLGCGAQTPFRVDVHLVNVGFSVRDSGGRLIGNLTQDDFEVFEDGVPQKIAFFARSKDVPLSLGLAVDISGSQGAFVRAHERDLRTFLHQALSARDNAFLLCFASNPRLVTEFTPSGRNLADALEGFQRTNHRRDYPMLGPVEIRTGGTAFYDAIYYSVAQMFANVDRGRRALIIFSDGEDNTSAHHMMDVIEIAQANDVLLYCVRYTELREGGRWTATNKYGRSVMERIARETGGSDYDARERELAEHFRQIGEELRSSYQLGYHSTNPVEDGTFHKIAIRVKQPGVTVRTKTGYYAKPGA